MNWRRTIMIIFFLLAILIAFGGLFMISSYGPKWLSEDQYGALVLTGVIVTAIVSFLSGLEDILALFSRFSSNNRTPSSRSALKAYLDWIIQSNQSLRLHGIQSSTGGPVHIKLDQIYVTLRTLTQTRIGAGEEHAEWLQLEKELPYGERSRASRLDHMAGMATVSVNRALAENKKLAIIGDPGCGKTTLLSYLALTYARDMRSERGLVKKTFSDDQTTLNEGRMLPIFIELRKLGADLDLIAKPAHLTGPADLLTLYRKLLDVAGVQVPEDFFESYLKSGQAIVLLDGLDEVADSELRGRISRLVEAFTAQYGKCRYLVSSRIAGYRGTTVLGQGFHTATVREFRMVDIEGFLTNWHQAVAEQELGRGVAAKRVAAKQTAELLNAIHRKKQIELLAINPLMLTIIALVHKEMVILPDRRAELYEKAIDVLLRTWDEGKGTVKGKTIVGRQIIPTQKRVILQSVALHMQEKRIREIELDSLKKILQSELSKIYGEQVLLENLTIRETFIQLIEERAGLLVARSRGIYGFSHLTFQEYLAACAVADLETEKFPYTLKRAGDVWWREVILLEAGYLSLTGRERVGRLIQEIANHQDEPTPYHNLVLALGCLSDVGEGQIDAEIEAHVQTELRSAISLPLEGKADQELLEATKVRGLAITALQKGGLGYWSGPWGEPEWITIPAGEFEMGGESGFDDSKPVHKLHLPEYQIARVPITNMQYAIFVKDSDHEPPDHWEGNHPQEEIETHPVTRVTWHDAIAYCKWLSEKTGKKITLPSEAEWEKAAGWDPVKKKKRIYPWGDEFNKLNLNSHDLGMGTTTPVGIFEEGASPFEVLDMSGNVWEWTRSNWKDYPYDPTDGREDLSAGADRRVLRGGAFLYGAVSVRVPFRYDFDPNFDFNDDFGFRVCVRSPISS